MRHASRYATLIALIALAAACAHQKPTGPVPAAEEETATDDAVQVGYGTQNRETVAGSVASVSGETANQTQPRNAEDLLRGRISGVSVFDTPDGIAVRIRGKTSPTSSNEPLYVLDGIPITPGPGGALVGLNPYDIDTIEVLKGASAAAYGRRAANGVILIKTRRGK
jgi:TonB-dependent SusC/RagA subfamily outer membrane receptor